MKKLIQHTKNILCNGGLFCLLLFLTYKLIFRKIDLHSIKKVLLNGDLKYLYLALSCAAGVVFIEALVIKRNLRLLGERVSYLKCVTYALSGNFFSAITPAATGGQPAQVYFMSRDKVPVSKGILALFMDLGAYQASIVLLAVAGYGMWFHKINASLGKFLPLLWIGIGLNVILLVVTMVAIFSKGLIENIVKVFLKIVGWILPKRVEGISVKAHESVEKFRACSQVLKRNKRAYVVNSMLTFVRIVLMHMAPYWVYKCLGLSGTGFLTIVALQSTLYISCASLPLPGTIGIGESVFLLFFKGVFTGKTIGGAMIISRSVSLYFTVIFCGIILAGVFIATKLRTPQREMVESA